MWQYVFGSVKTIKKKIFSDLDIQWKLSWGTDITNVGLSFYWSLVFIPRQHIHMVIMNLSMMLMIQICQRKLLLKVWSKVWMADIELDELQGVRQWRLIFSQVSVLCFEASLIYFFLGILPLNCWSLPRKY